MPPAARHQPISARGKKMATLIVFSGLPASGKSSIARALAREIGAIWLRINSIAGAISASKRRFRRWPTTAGGRQARNPDRACRDGSDPR